MSANETRTVNDARNPRYIDKDHTLIDIEVDFDELDQVYVDYTITPYDTLPHGVQLRNDVLNGVYGAISPWPGVPDDITGDEALDLLRFERNFLLEQTDYVESPTYWAALSADQQAEWTTYRNALRNMTTTYPNPVWTWTDDGLTSIPSNFSWPQKP